MSVELKAVFFGVAVALFVCHALGVRSRVDLQALGLSFFATPFFVDALEAM